MALWDALARLHGVSLTRLLGGTEKSVPAYGAVGYDGEAKSARVAEDWAKRGFGGVKAKIGYPTVGEDVAVIRAMRKAVGPDVAIMVDFNQSLTPAEAVQRMRSLDDEGSDVGRGAHARARLRRATRSSRAKPPRRFSAARTGGARSTSSTPSTRTPPTTSCPTS